MSPPAPPLNEILPTNSFQYSTTKPIPSLSLSLLLFPSLIYCLSSIPLLLSSFLTPSLSLSLLHSLPSLPPSLTPSLPHLLTHSLTPSLTPSLPHLLSTSLTPSLPPTLPPSPPTDSCSECI